MTNLSRGERTFQVPCTVEIEHTAESLHAHVELEGVEAGPGDRVIVQGIDKVHPGMLVKAVAAQQSATTASVQ